MSFSVSEYTKIYVDWDFASDPTGGAYSAPQTPIWFQGRTRDWEKGGEMENGEGRGMGE